MSTVGTDTIRRSVDVPLQPERAFALFTERASTWWPFATHSVAGEAAEEAIFEPRVGGRVYESDAAPELIEGYGGGWEQVLRTFAARAT